MLVWLEIKLFHKRWHQNGNSSGVSMVADKRHSLSKADNHIDSYTTMLTNSTPGIFCKKKKKHNLAYLHLYIDEDKTLVNVNVD